MVQIDDMEVVLPSKEKGKLKAVCHSGLPWVEKYRPNDLSDLVSHQEIINTISTFIEKDKLPHMLFYGPPGTGKTSTILALARKLYGNSYKNMILELNASDDRGIDVVRDQIKNFASAKTLFSSGFKLIILDEADNMTQAAQNALRRIIEKYTRNVRFCIICNYVSKIIPAIQSRCTRFRFAPLSVDQISNRLQTIITEEGYVFWLDCRIKITDDGMAGLIRLSCGDMRRALNILQSTHAAYNVITEETIYTCTGSPLPADMDSVVNWLFGLEFNQCYASKYFLELIIDIFKIGNEKGYALTDMITELTRNLSEMEIPNDVRIFLLDNMATIEHNLSIGSTNKIQLGYLVGTFKLAVELVQKK